jgi:predicted nucleic acid-binding protein
VRLVIADTGPINYLVLIDCIDLLPALFQKVILPTAVQRELDDRETPASVRTWIANPPAWVEVNEAPSPDISRTN